MFLQFPVSDLLPLCTELGMEADGICSPICALSQDTMTTYVFLYMDNTKATRISQQNKTH